MTPQHWRSCYRGHWGLGPTQEEKNMSKGTVSGKGAFKIFAISLDFTANIFSTKQINSESSILLAEKSLKADQNKHCPLILMTGSVLIIIQAVRAQNLFILLVVCTKETILPVSSLLGVIRKGFKRK